MSNTYDATSAQLATISASAERLARTRAHFHSLDEHAAQLRTKLDEAAGDATAGPIRGELETVQRSHRQVAGILAEVEAEHARHEADLAALYGGSGSARATLTKWQTDRDAARASLDQAGDVLARARAHAEAVERRLTAARADEARHDAEAAATLHEALRDGAELPTAAAGLARVSVGLDDDARAARAAEARAAQTHRQKGSAHAEAERRVAGAVDAVLSAEADAMAREVAALDARADLLRGRLTAFAARTRADYVTPQDPAPDSSRNPWSPVPASRGVVSAPRVAVSSAVTAALMDPATVRRMPRDTARDARAWADLASALVTDAEAVSAFATDAAPAAKPAPNGCDTRMPSSWDFNHQDAAEAAA